MHCSLSRDEKRLRSIKEKIVHYSLSRDERRLRSIKRENNALFFVKGGEETEVNKKRK